MAKNSATIFHKWCHQTATQEEECWLNNSHQHQSPIEFKKPSYHHHQTRFSFFIPDLLPPKIAAPSSSFLPPFHPILSSFQALITHILQDFHFLLLVSLNWGRIQTLDWFFFCEFVVVEISCSTPLIEDMWCDYDNLWLIYQVFSGIEIESCMKNKIDSKLESET